MPGLTLSRILYEEAVMPLLADQAPGLPYAAGLFGAGSDALGYDTARSMDHDWGPRLVLVLDDADLDEWSLRLDAMLRWSLPQSVAGFPTGTAEFAAEPGTRYMTESDEGAPVNHLITITSPRAWLVDRHGIESIDELTPATWVTLSEQALLETTSGTLFRDDTGAFTAIRKALAFYPDDVWRYRMAAQWKRIDQLEPFVGRCGEVEDDLGSQLVAMSLVRDVMKLAFLMERQYAPYPKWFGTGFARLAAAPSLAPDLDRARYALAWSEREAGVVAAVETLARRHNELGLTSWVDPTPRPFFDRPFQVMFAARFAEALMVTVNDPDVLAMPLHMGGLDQYIDSTDAMNAQGLHRAIREWMRDSDP